METKSERQGNVKLRKDRDVAAKILNGIVGRTDEKIEYEADSRQAQNIIEQFMLEGAKDVSTPASKACVESIKEDRFLGLQFDAHYINISARCD